MDSKEVSFQAEEREQIKENTENSVTCSINKMYQVIWEFKGENTQYYHKDITKKVVNELHLEERGGKIGESILGRMSII